MGISRLLLPSILLDHVGQLDDELALLVLLTLLKGMFIFPPKGGVAAVAVDVSDGVEPGEQDPLFGRPAPHVDDAVEEVGSPGAALEALANEFVMVCEVGPAVDAGVCSVAGRQVGSERLHLKKEVDGR